MGRMSEGLNVFFPSSASPRTQTVQLSFVFPCPGCHRGWVCAVHSHCWWHFPFHPCGFWRAPPVASTDIRILGMGFFLAGFRFSGKLLEKDTDWKPCLFHRLEVETGLKFRTVISPVLLLSTITFNSWNFGLLFMWISQIVFILIPINLLWMFWITW